MSRGNLDEVLEALEVFEKRFPDLDTEERLFFVLGGMSAGEKTWTSRDMEQVVNYFTNGGSKNEFVGRNGKGTGRSF